MNLNFALGPSAQGTPLTQSTLAQLRQGMQGGQGTQQFFSNQSALYHFTQYLSSQGDSAWISSTQEDTGYPVWFAMQESRDAQGKNHQIYSVVAPQVDQDAVQGKSTPAQFTWNGETYNIVGSISVTLSYDAIPDWEVIVPLGLLAAIPASSLAGVVWANLLSPLVDGALNMVRTAFQRAPEVNGEGDVDPIAEEAAENAEVDGAEVAEDSVSLVAGSAAAVGLVVILAVPFIVAALGHPSYQTLKVYNLTKYDLTWSSTLTKGAMNLAPSTGQGNNLEYVIPAAANSAPPGITPVPVAHEADFSFVSASNFSGIGYVLGFTLTDPLTDQLVTQGNALFSVPWSGENSLAAAITTQEPLSWWDANNGKENVTQVTAAGAGVTVTATFDFLSGKHPAPNGQETYTYNSLLVFETAS
jgi:hypothetical protein